MDQLPVADTPIPQEYKSKKIASPFISFCFLFGIVFFIVILLNYFNILRLDLRFSLLSFLPHMPLSTSQRIAITPDQYYTYSNLQQTIDETNRSNIKNVINNNLLPANLSTLSTSQNENVFSSDWQVNSINFHTETVYRGYDLSSYSISLVDNSTTVTNFSVNTITPVIQTYLTTQNYGRMFCTTSNCKTFNYQNNVTNGYIGYIISKNQKNNVTLFFCLIPKSSPLFNKISSCNAIEKVF